MQVTCTGALPPTQPYRASNGITFSWRRGDVVLPLDFFSGAGWFSDKPPFREVLRSYTRLWVPFVSMRLGRWGMYAGAKCFGVDSPDYLRILPAGDVYAGSLALLPSFRMTTQLEKAS